MKQHQIFQIIGALFLILFLTPYSTGASPTDCREALNEPQFENAQERRLTFKSVAVLRRNNSIGIQQIGSLEFAKYIDLSSDDQTGSRYNLVGLTQEGQVFHLVDFGSKKVARLLSGTKTMKDIFLVNKKHLGALDQSGYRFYYSSTLWSQSPRNLAIKRGTKLWAALSSVFTIGAVAGFSDLLQMGPEVGDFTLSIPLTFSYLSAGLSAGWYSLLFYDQKNTYPDGFVNENNLNRRESYLFDSDHPILQSDILSPVSDETTEGIR